MPDAWDPGFLDRSPMFDPLRQHAAAVLGSGWPTLDDLQRMLALREPRPTSRRGSPLAFVAQGRKAGTWEEKYEARLYLKGEIQIRAENWHDLLNALVWLTFPQAKAALNARHYRAMLEQRQVGAKNRGPVQDALTLFDEGGVIVTASDRGLLRMLEEFAWKDLFWRSRMRVMAGMRFHLFGHALYEKALHPFAGITGRGILFEVDAAFFDDPLAVQIARLDARVAERLLDPARLRAPPDLPPVPILGVPGWCAANARESYYDDIDHFRPGRGRRRIET